MSATLADVLLKHLTEFKDGKRFYYKPLCTRLNDFTENSTVSYAYHTVMISLVTVVMFDGRFVTMIK